MVSARKREVANSLPVKPDQSSIVRFVPKRRRKAIFGQTRRHWGQIFHVLARQKERQIIEGHLMPAHVHRCTAIPPKHPVASAIEFVKGKSAIAMDWLYCYTRRHK